MRIDLNSLSEKERIRVEIFVLGMRRAASRGVEWDKITPWVRMGGWSCRDEEDLVFPHFDEREAVDLVNPSRKLDEDTKDRMERAEVNRVERHRKEDGTDELPGLAEPEEEHIDTDTDEEIIRVLEAAERPMKRAAIARKLGRKPDSTYVYERLKHLCDHEPRRVRRCNGYTFWLISRGKPPD